jgi:LacI family repressor for deo operon, udp, cdd, tsx, nupC, and nupG
MESIGIAEVAALAGVSPATVSRALRGIPGVAAATREAVREAAEKLGYVASPSAASLSTGRSSAIGILAPWLSRWFFAAAIEGVQATLHESGYDLLLYPAGSGSVSGIGTIDVRALHKRVDGVVALNVPVGIDSLSDFRIPVVTIGGWYAGMGAVSIDDIWVGRQATDHLLALGHRVISFLGEDPDRVYGFTAASDRLTGYRRALAAANVAYNAALVETTGFSIQGGEDGFCRQWSLAQSGQIPFPTAVCAVSDEVAMGVMHAAARLGLRVPGDVSVIGVDDHDMAYLFNLTTISQPVRQQGRLAAQILIEQIRNPTKLAPRRTVKSELIIRSSTGVVPNTTAARAG